MSLELAILGFLSERPRSGYDLKTRCFDDAVRLFWTADQAQIYRTLERMRAAKLVAYTRRRQTGKPDRKIYEITRAGLDTLAALLPESRPLPAPRDPFLLQLYFSAKLADGEIERLLADRREAHQSRLEELRAMAVELSRDRVLGEREFALRQAAFAGAIASERAAIDWLDDIHESVAAGHLPAETSHEHAHRTAQLGPSPA